MTFGLSRILMINLFVACAYYLGARAGLYFATINSTASPVWPATGIAMAATILLGWRCLPGIWLAAFAANFHTDASVFLSSVIAFGNTAEAVAGRLVFRLCLQSRRQFHDYAESAGIIAAACFATMFSATIGCLALQHVGGLDLSNFMETWITWWAGDALGALFIAPLILGFPGRKLLWASQARSLLGGALIAIFTLAIANFIFSHEVASAMLFAVFFCLLVSALALPQTALRWISALIATSAIYHAVNGNGPFNNGSLNLNLVHLQFFLAAMGITSLVLEGFRKAGHLRNSWLVLVSGWTLSGILFFGFHQFQSRNDHLRFKSIVNDVNARIQSRIQSNVNVMLSIASLFSASKVVEPDEWKRFVSGQNLYERYPGLLALNVVLTNGIKLNFELRPHTPSANPDYERAESVARQTGKPAMAGRGPEYRLYLPLLSNTGEFRGWIFSTVHLEKAIAAALAEYKSQVNFNILPEPVTAKNSGAEVVDKLILLDKEFFLSYSRAQAFENYDDGSLAWAGFSAAILTLLSAGFVASLQSINVRALKLAESQTKALRETREQYELAVRGSHDGIWDWNILEDRVYYSARWKEIFGYRDDELESSYSTWNRLIHPEDTELNTKHLDDYLNHRVRTYEFEGRFLHKDGTYRWCLVRGEALFDASGKAFRMAGSLTDITVRKTAEMQIIAARESAEAATKAKSEFLANMSHEIRTPLTGLLGTAKLMRNTNLNASQLDYLEVMHQSADSLLVMLNDILDFSKIEANKVSLEHIEFDLVDMASDLAKMMSFGAAQKDIDFETEFPRDLTRAVIGDPARIRQILINLISNAVKFTNIGSVRFQVRLLKTENSHVTVRFEVIDTGIGISADAMEAIFAPFSQADTSTTRKFGGTGLGLSICKRLAKLMNSDLKAQSRPDVGSVFWFDLEMPLGDDLRPLLQDDDTSAVAVTAGARILIAEDNLINQRVLMELLQQAGYSVRGAGNGREALNVLASAEVDLVLMDCQMPEVDGFQATEEWRRTRHPRGESLPIIALTADTTKAVRDRALLSGMNDYLSKPVRFEVLIRMIENWLAKDLSGTPKLLIDERKIAELSNPETLGSPELLRDVIGMFIDQAPGLVLRMSSAAGSKDWTAVKKAAHSLKSASGTLGIVSLQNACAAVEDCVADESRVSEVGSRIQKCADLLREAKEKMETRLSSTPQA